MIDFIFKKLEEMHHLNIQENPCIDDLTTTEIGTIISGHLNLFCEKFENFNDAMEKYQIIF